MKTFLHDLHRSRLVFFLFTFLIILIQGCMTEARNSSEDVNLPDPVRVGPAGYHSSFSYYNTSPESPDGKLISYVKYNSVPKVKRYEPITAEIWICNNDLSNHRKVVDIEMRGLHNGARVQWLDNSSFVYQDDSIRVVTIDGNKRIKAVAGTVGHNPYGGRFLYAGIDEETELYSIFEYDVSNQKIEKLGDAGNYTKIKELYPTTELRPLEKRKILHLQYSPNGKKIAFRLDIGPSEESFKHLITQNIDGSDIRFFGPKPMHFAWYDSASFMGHDNQIDDGMPNDKSLRRWDLEGNYIEKLSGPGNHLGASFDRQTFASESWYGENPIILRAFKKGESTPFWEDTVSTDSNVTWTLGNHVNPSFSRDNNRIYYHKLTSDNLVQAYMVTLNK